MVTASGNLEAQENVHDLDPFVTVQILDERPAVLSLVKLCEEHGYTYEWVSGQKPRLTKQGKNIICNSDNFVPLVAPGLRVPQAVRLEHRESRMERLKIHQKEIHPHNFA